MNTTTLAFIGVVLIGIACLFMLSTTSPQPTDLQAAVSGSAPKPAGLTILSPNGGEVFNASSTQKIMWSGGDSKWTVSLHLMNEARTKTIKTITAKTANTGSYPWIITSDIPAGKYYLRAACVNCKSNVAGRTDFSDAPLAIVKPPFVSFVSSSSDAEAGDAASDDLGIFTIKYKIAATDADVYVPRGIFIAPATTTDSSTRLMMTMVRVERAGVTVSNGVTSVMSSTASVFNENLYLIKAGTSETVTVTTNVSLSEAGTAGMYRVSVEGISWDPTGDLPYNLTADVFSTDYRALN